MTQATQTKEVNTMSQKYEALQAYEKLKDNYDCNTEWPILATRAVHLVPTSEDLPDDTNAFVEQKVVQLISMVKERFSKSSYPLFVRACPLVPRPGVLESSRADSILDVEVVAHRIITTMMSPDTSDEPMYEHGITDPHGTVMVQPFINADASAVAAPDNYILMGRDNDGITAGKDGLRIAIPIGDDASTRYDLRKLGLSPDKVEVEFVSELKHGIIPKREFLRDSHQSYMNQKVAMVQLRGSEGVRSISPPPKGVTISGTFHGAERITINHIHLVSDNTDEQLDLMEQALREGMPEGSVVLHPNGSHLSHHAGQCFKYGVPYIASNNPRVGEQWTQAALGWVVLDNDGTFEPQPYDPLDYTDEFIAGFNAGFTNFARQHGWLSNHFHQFIGGPIGNPAETAHLAGGYVAWLINGTLSVGLGELRHITGSVQNATMLPFVAVASIYGVDNWKEVRHEGISQNRRHFYTMVERHPATIESVIGMLKFAESCYKLEWQSGYGGHKYGLSCRNARQLAESMLSFLADPSGTEMKHVISKANLTEHNVHNNGFFFNKFISKTALDWGTNPDLVRLQPRNFFSIYYAAEDLMNSKPRLAGDFTDILSTVASITKTDMQKKPLGKRNDELGRAVAYIGNMYRHPSGIYSDYTANTFIPCGHVGCEVCAQHTAHIASTLTKDYLPTTESYEASFPVNKQAENNNAFKLLSKEDDETFAHPTKVPQALAVLIHGLTHDGVKDVEKYIALIVSKLNSEQLIEFSTYKKTLEGDE